MPKFSEWEKIETAPKDGTEFVMLDANVNTATVGHWMADVGWLNKPVPIGGAKHEPRWFPLATPTHWMPLPQTPEQPNGND